AREAQNELHATADRTLGQIGRFVDARCDDLRLWGSLLPASPAPPAGRAALERYLARVSAASRQPWRLLALVDRDGTILASSAPGPRAGEVEGDPGPVQGGHSECGVAFRAGATPSLVLGHAAGSTDARLVGVTDLSPIRQIVHEARFEEVPQG